MSASKIAPPSPPLPELPRYFHATRSYQPRPICTCDTPQEKTYLEPLIFCRARAQKCPTHCYHAACIGEVARHPLDTTPWYCAHCMSDDVIPTRVCTCGDDPPHVSGPIVQCRRRAACFIRWYHRACVGSPEEEEEWICEECEREDKEDDAKSKWQQQQQKQPQKQPQQKHIQQQSQKTLQAQQFQPTQQRRQKRRHENEPGDNKDSEPPTKRVSETWQKRQKRQKCQHQGEPEDDKDAAPPAKRVRFSSNPLSGEPVVPTKRPAEVSPERSERNADDPEERGPDKGLRDQSPDEVGYCFCGKPSSMEMVACDGKKCEREWFHFECVGMTEEAVPKGKWYCDDCSVKEAKKKKGRQGNRSGRKRKR